MSSTFWTVEKEETCLQLLKAGMTGHQIAMEIGAPSRNAVIGKINRKGWRGLSPNARENKPMKAKRVKQVQRTRSHALALPPASSPPLPAPTNHAAQSFASEGPKRFVDLGARDCKWPLGDPRQAGFCFCAAPRLREFPYCAEHVETAYNFR